MPFFRTFLRKLGHFSFNREDPAARLQQAEEIEQALRRGESVFVFPEGTFTAQAGVRPFHLGAFKAAIATGRPIVPIALAGTRRALRDGTWLPRRGRITITICPPIVPQPGASDWQEIVRVRERRAKKSPVTRANPSCKFFFVAGNRCTKMVHLKSCSDMLFFVSNGLGSLRVGFSVSFITDLHWIAASKIHRPRGDTKHA